MIGEAISGPPLGSDQATPSLDVAPSFRLRSPSAPALTAYRPPPAPPIPPPGPPPPPPPPGGRPPPKPPPKPPPPRPPAPTKSVSSSATGDDEACPLPMLSSQSCLPVAGS